MCVCIYMYTHMISEYTAVLLHQPVYSQLAIHSCSSYSCILEATILSYHVTSVGTGLNSRSSALDHSATDTNLT